MSLVDKVREIEYCPKCGTEVISDERIDNEPAPTKGVSHMETVRVKVNCPNCTFSRCPSRSWFVSEDNPRAIDEKLNYPDLRDWRPY